MKKLCVLLAGAAAIVAVPAQAKDCGPPPLDVPVVPAGATASAEDIRTARNMVLSYSNKVDEFLGCMENRTSKFAPYMTKEQIARRQEDLNDLHNDRRDLQIQLNEAIRAYRRSQQSR